MFCKSIVKIAKIAPCASIVCQSVVIFFGRWENYFGRWKIYFGSWKSDFQSKAPNGAEQESEMFSSSRLACQGLVIIIIRMHYALWPWKLLSALADPQIHSTSLLSKLWSPKQYTCNRHSLLSSCHPQQYTRNHHCHPSLDFKYRCCLFSFFIHMQCSAHAWH